MLLITYIVVCGSPEEIIGEDLFYILIDLTFCKLWYLIVSIMDKGNIDLALHKKVLEYCNHYEPLTDGKDNEYDTTTGYCATHWPGYITVDLEDVYALKQISFQLWDFEDSRNVYRYKQKCTNQLYVYRLLVSEDLHNWQVIYDTTNSSKKYRKGWQAFLFKETCKARYIRIHAVHNLRNSGFHVVRLHAFQDKEPKFIEGDIQICEPNFEWEQGDAYPLANQLLDLAGRIQNIMPKDGISPDLKAKYSLLVEYLFEKSKELEAVNGKIDELRKLISEPISNKLKKDFKKNARDGIIGAVLTFVSFIIWLIIFLVE